MARKARMQYPGALYHVYNRGLDRWDLFWDDRDRAYFLDSLAMGVERFHAEIHAYCVKTPRIACPLPSLLQQSYRSLLRQY